MAAYSDAIHHDHPISQLPCRRFSSGPEVEPAAGTIRILIAGGHVFFRDCLHALMDSIPRYKVAGDACDKVSMFQMMRECNPDLLLLDWGLSQQDGMEVLRELSASGQAPRIILLAFQSDTPDVSSAIQLGVAGILSSETTRESLCEAITKVMKGEYFFGQAGLASLVQCATNRNENTAIQNSARRFGITRRELDIVKEVAAGYTTMEIAERLSLSTNTLKHHMSHIYDKLGVSNRLELVLFVMNHKLVAFER